jgi:hypothetical protein
MRKHLALLMALAMVLCTLVVARPAHAITDEEIADAIDKIKAYLYRSQDQQVGGWFGQYHAAPNAPADKNTGGPTAIATLALLVSGESMQKPQIEKALRYLREVEMTGVYAMSLRVHVWSYLPDSFLPQLEVDASALLQGAHPQRSTFDYLFYRHTERLDHSTTQYGILAMWQAAKRGARINPSFWANAEKHFIAYQRPDGGWGYSGRDNPRATMTCAGLTCLYVVLQEIHRGKDTPPKETMDSIARGLDWMDKNYNPGTGAHGGAGYYQYGVERVGLASGIRFFRNNRGDHDWFEDIASRIAPGAGGGGSVVNSSFQLMFLSRGRVPVWITKIQVPGANWNNRPNDLHFLTQFLSDSREQELNWQSIPIDIDPEKWINAPMAYLASDQEIAFTDEQKQQIKKFIDLGGTLLCNPDKASPGFIKSITALAGELYPQYKLAPLSTEHALYNAMYPIRGGFRFRGVSNGARDLILLSETDIGKMFQQDTQYERNDVWKLAMNLFALASDRGVLTNRLVKVIDDHPGRASNEMEIVRAVYDGNWNPEPGAWWPISARLATAASLDLKPVDVKLEEIGTSDAKLVHLAGVEAMTLTDEQKAAIEAYVQRGGTLLIETVGGRGSFSIEMDRQLREMFKNPSVPLQNTDPVITGGGLAGTVNCSTVGYRRHAILNANLRNTPRLAAFRVNDRPAVLISHEDLSLGSLRARQMGISGYQPESARGLMSNIVLQARKQTMGEAAQVSMATPE